MWSGTDGRRLFFTSIGRRKTQPALAARADRFTPIHRVRLEHNIVAGADEMVVYETAWNRWRPGHQACPRSG